MTPRAPHHSRIGLARIAVVVFVATGVWFVAGGGCPAEAVGPAERTPAAGTADSVPTSLHEVGEYGELVYDAAKARDWRKTTVDLARLKSAARQLRLDLPSAPDLPRLRTALTALETAAARKDRLATMRQANQVTLIAANMTDPFHPVVPPDVVRLDYLGRELEIWAEARDAARLQSTAAELTRTWHSVRPAIEARGPTPLSKDFGDLVARVRSARSFDDYARLAPRLLEAVDRLEGVFRK
jgi:hypothetical protein